MAITLVDTYNFTAAAAAEVCLAACALLALWWGHSKTHANLRFHGGNSKSPKLVHAPGADPETAAEAAGSAASPPKSDDSAQFTSVYDLVLWRLHAEAGQPAAPELEADASSQRLPPWRRPQPPASPGEGDPGLDFQAFLGSLEQHCDQALDGLCEQAMVQQGDSVLMDLELDFEALGDGALPTRELDTELPRDEVPEPEDEQDRDYDDLCDSALVDFELDTKLHRDVVPEPEGEQDRAYDDLYASHLAALEEKDWRLFGSVESAASRQLSCTSVHARLMERLSKTLTEYMLWAL